MSKCRYPDWEGGVETGEHRPDKDGFCNVCGMNLNTEKDAMRRPVDSSDRKAAYDMRKQESAHCGTSKPQGSREILRDPSFIDRATITWFVAYATATGLVILALLT